MQKVIVFGMLLMLPVVICAQKAPYDTLTIHQIQYVENPTVANQETQYLNDTITVKGFVYHLPRELWVGARWACYLVESLTEPPLPWSGFFVIQDDTTGNAANTMLGFVEEGDEAYFTGRLTTYTGLTQLNILTNPLVPVDVVSYANPMPQPKLLTLADLATHAAGEQWEDLYVRVENVTIVNRSYSSNMAVITDGTATGYIDDYFMIFRRQFDNGINPWPSNGTTLNIQGFTRDVGAEYFTINPRNYGDIEIMTNPPVISSVRRDIGTPTSTDAVMISAKIVDNGTVQEAKLHVSVNWEPFQAIDMIEMAADTFMSQIDPQPDGAYVRYFIKATDNSAESSMVPGDTSKQVYFYVVRNAGLKIKDVQYTYGYSHDASGFVGFPVTLEGVVMTDPTDYINNYYIQEKDSAWSGIWVYDNAHQPAKGDWIRVTGTVQENYYVTRLGNVTAYEVVTPGFGAFAPVPVTTGEINTTGPHGEAYESVLIQVDNLIVTNPFPDSPGNYGEIEIDDGTGPVRVDDAFNACSLNLDSTYSQGDAIERLIGLHYYSFNNYKILPRDSSDIIGHVTGLPDEPEIATLFRLDQNYPNPFNNETRIKFQMADFGPVQITVYNARGQKVRTLFRAQLAPGSYEVTWNGRDDTGNALASGIYFYRLQAGQMVATRKMLFLK